MPLSDPSLTATATNCPRPQSRGEAIRTVRTVLKLRVDQEERRLRTVRPRALVSSKTRLRTAGSAMR